MKRQLTWLFSLALAATVALPPFPTQAASDLKMLSSWNEKYQARKFAAEEFISRVEKASDGKIKFSINGPEVVPPFEQLQPVSSGVFDLLFTHGVYHLGSKGLAMAFDAVKADPTKRRSAGLWDLLDEYYQQSNNLKLIGLFADGSYGIILKKPLTADGDWKGMKIRGTKSYHGMIRALGGSPVVLPAGQIYSGLEKGVIDGAAWPATGPLDFKWYEVADYRVRPTFGSVTHVILMNLDKFKSLSSDDKKLLLDTAQRLEQDVMDPALKIQENEDVQLQNLGMKTTQLSPNNLALIEKAWSESTWENAAQCCGETGKKLKALAKKAGLTE